MKKNKRIQKMIMGAMILFFLWTSGCAAERGSDPQAWIDAPREGASITMGESVTVASHLFDRDGVAEVVLSVNGEPYRQDIPSEDGGDFVSIRQEWRPDAPGTYLLRVQGFDRQGEPGNPDTVSILIREEAELVKPLTPAEAAPAATELPTPVISVTPEITITPTLPPPSTITFYADPPTIKAESCSTLYWNVANAKRVIFGGVDQPFSGSFQACLCESARYPLRVVNLDGTETVQTVDVAVTGTCVTETPEPPAADTTPPSIPSPAVPANGLELSCRSSQNLVWLPSTDDASGVSGYFVKLEVQIKAGEWQSAGGYGPLSDKQVNVNVNCGGVYRWMVRAQDGAGNFSSWSAPSTFSVVLN